jgi:hypothetical protein
MSVDSEQHDDGACEPLPRERTMLRRNPTFPCVWLPTGSVALISQLTQDSVQTPPTAALGQLATVSSKEPFRGVKHVGRSR